MGVIKLYPECIRLLGYKKDPFTRVNDERHEPVVSSCDKCDHFGRCLSQYRRFHGEPETDVRLPETIDDVDEPIDIHKIYYWLYHGKKIENKRRKRK